MCTMCEPCACRGQGGLWTPQTRVPEAVSHLMYAGDGSYAISGSSEFNCWCIFPALDPAFLLAIEEFFKQGQTGVSLERVYCVSARLRTQKKWLLIEASEDRSHQGKT